MTTCLRLLRSATIPPIGATRKTGIWLENPTAPSSNPEPVSLYTSQDCATVCIHVPISEINCPLKKSWKLRCRRARPAACQRPPAALAALSVDAFSWMGFFESATFSSLDEAAPFWHQYIVAQSTGRFATRGKQLAICMIQRWNRALRRPKFSTAPAPPTEFCDAQIPASTGK